MALATQPEVWVDGRPLTSFARGWGDLKITHRWPFGCWELAFTVPVRGAQRFTQLRSGAPVEARYGATPIWRGFMSEPDWDTGEMVALGLSRQGETVLALDADGLIAETADEAIDQAIAEGYVDWVRRESISSTSLVDGSTTSRPIYLNDFISAATKIDDKGWGVNPRGEVYATTDPTSPTLAVMPDSGVLGVADDAQARLMVGRYLSAPTTYANVAVGSGVPQVGVSLASLGVIDNTRATAIVTGLLAQTQARRGWTNSLELAAGQMTNLGGAGINIATVRADGFQAARLHGLRDDRGLSASTVVGLAETVWNVPDRTVQISPIGLVARDLGAIAEGAGAELLTGL